MSTEFLPPASLKPRFSGFTSPKNTTPIEFSKRWHQSALLQAALSPEIATMACAPNSLGAEMAFSVRTIAGGSFTIALHETKPASHQGDALIWSRADVMAEPRRTTCQTLWASRDTPVSAGDRLRILAKLADAPAGLSIRELAACVRAPDADEYDVVAALICVGSLVLDLGAELTPETLVRRRATQENYANRPVQMENSQEKTCENRTGGMQKKQRKPAPEGLSKPRARPLNRVQGELLLPITGGRSTTADPVHFAYESVGHDEKLRAAGHPRGK
jgi:hypothetical protein